MESAIVELRQLGETSLQVSRLGLGLAAVGRPGYINLGREDDLPGARQPEDLYARCAELLEAARSLGVCYVDVARSYGRAEEFLARWLDRRGDRGEITVGSKWGYRYTADWQVEAEVHEQKELSRARFAEQLDESVATLGEPIDLYQIHSATMESGALDDDALIDSMLQARAAGRVRRLGLTVTGPGSAETLNRAMDLERNGERVFDAVQATCNVLEHSILGQLRRARGAGFGVIVKEVHANGRLTPANQRREDRGVVRRLGNLAAERGLSVDQLAIAFVASHDCVDVINSGAATVDQLDSHARGAAIRLDADSIAALSCFAELPEVYWSKRSQLPWS